MRLRVKTRQRLPGNISNSSVALPLHCLLRFFEQLVLPSNNFWIHPTATCGVLRKAGCERHIKDQDHHWRTELRGMCTEGGTSLWAQIGRVGNGEFSEGKPAANNGVKNRECL